MGVHNLENVFKFQEGWREDEGFQCCTYCGSLSVSDAIKLLRTPGIRFSGSDWKYGWPHKFYISGFDNGRGKFYNVHLKECSDEELKEFSALSKERFGVIFGKDEKGLWYKAVSAGFQTWGVIGPDGEPIFDYKCEPPKWWHEVDVAQLNRKTD